LGCRLVHRAGRRGTDRLRTCLMATHTDADIDLALSAFEESGKALGLI
jgi:7-keto-8-aminopelargonate synthetase-like enzyme